MFKVRNSNQRLNIMLQAPSNLSLNYIQNGNLSTDIKTLLDLLLHTIINNFIVSNISLFVFFYFTLFLMYCFSLVLFHLFMLLCKLEVPVQGINKRYISFLTSSLNDF